MNIRTSGVLCAVLLALSPLAPPSAAVGATVPAITPLSGAMRAAMIGKSWKPGCPVSLDDLRSVRVAYLGFDGFTHTGIIVAHKRLANEVASIFAELYAARFPIRKVAPWEQYGPDVYAERDITVGFYCEKADDAPTEWSSHAYGIAIDVNPLENPFLNRKHVWWPKSAAQYGPRDNVRGKITTASAAFKIFTRHGWYWGGLYVGESDYMHFNKVIVGDSRNPLERPYLVNSLQYVPGQ